MRPAGTSFGIWGPEQRIDTVRIIGPYEIFRFCDGWRLLIFSILQPQVAWNVFWATLPCEEGLAKLLGNSFLPAQGPCRVQSIALKRKMLGFVSSRRKCMLQYHNSSKLYILLVAILWECSQTRWRENGIHGTGRAFLEPRCLFRGCMAAIGGTYHWAVRWHVFIFDIMTYTFLERHPVG